MSAFLLLLVLALVLAACGSPTGGPTNPGSTPGSTPTNTEIPGYGTANGCPSDTVVEKAPLKANVLVAHTDTNVTIVARQGDVVEIDLPFGRRWGTPSITGGLDMQQPAGYAWKPAHVCVWRFTAKSPGTAQVVFSARALCKAGELCPLYVMEFPFTITIK